jgi:hypothetical protein
MHINGNPDFRGNIQPTYTIQQTPSKLTWPFPVCTSIQTCGCISLVLLELKRKGVSTPKASTAAGPPESPDACSFVSSIQIAIIDLFIEKKIVVAQYCVL